MKIFKYVFSCLIPFIIFGWIIINGVIFMACGVLMFYEKIHPNHPQEIIEENNRRGYTIFISLVLTNTFVAVLSLKQSKKKGEECVISYLEELRDKSVHMTPTELVGNVKEKIIYGLDV